MDAAQIACVNDLAPHGPVVAYVTSGIIKGARSHVSGDRAPVIVSRQPRLQLMRLTDHSARGADGDHRRAPSAELHADLLRRCC